MRKVTQQVVSAFLAGHSKSVSNTSTDGQRLLLHGNCIAEKTPEGIKIRTCGWDTPTTKERLRAIPGVQVYTHRHQLHLNGKPWDGSDTLVTA